MIDTALFGLLHVLVFVYWLGGDLGAFYSSRFLTEPNVPADRRFLAAKIVGDVDMAPRTALILALPTGVLLAISKGWVVWPMAWGWVALGLSLAWLALAWRLHLAHGAAPAMAKTIDLAIRWALALALISAGAMGLAGAVALPTFIAIKCLLLAGAVFVGLTIRVVLKPLGPALAGLAGPDSAAAEASLATTLSRTRPLVVLIWLLIGTAAFLGLWAPA